MNRSALRNYLKSLLIVVPIVPLAGCWPLPGGCGDLGVSVEYVALPDGGYQGDGGVGDGGKLSANECTRLCGDTTMCELTTSDAGQPVVECDTKRTCVGGRRPAGLLPSGAIAARDPVGEWFARMAHLEHASVEAFLRLRAELLAHGAPRRLIDAAMGAARDEVRHARLVGALARRFGGAPATAEVTPIGPRSLEELAIENATEGCVGETWGALIALAQADAAGDEPVRDAMRGIAEDEARHAELAWAIAAWADSRLDPGARARVAEARARAADTLVAQLATEPKSEPLIRIAGLPEPSRAAALAEEMRRTLWAA